MRLMKIIGIFLLSTVPFLLFAQEADEELNADYFKGIRLPIKTETLLSLQPNATTSKDIAYTFKSFVALNYPLKGKTDPEKYQKELEKYKEKFEKKGKVPIKFYVDISEANPKDKKTAGKPVRYYKGKSEAYFIDDKTKKLVLSIKENNVKLCPT